MGITHFGNSEGNRGLKYGSCLWYGTEIFCNRPFWTSQSLRANGITRTAGTNDWCINSDNTSNSYHFVDIVIWSCQISTTISIDHAMFALSFLTGVHTNYLMVMNAFNVVRTNNVINRQIMSKDPQMKMFFGIQAGICDFRADRVQDLVSWLLMGYRI